MPEKEVRENPMFLELTKDIVFKTLWYRGNSGVRKYLERMVEYALGHPIGKYTLGPNVQGILSYGQIANEVDILLVSEDKTYKVNVEMNRLDKEKTSKERIKSSDNKSDVYLSNFVANFYNDLEDKKYKEAIRVEQVNFNNYYCPENKLISKLDFEFVDLNYMIVKNGIKSHLLYLSRLKDLCYNQKEDIYKDFALLLSSSYEEMEELARGNKEREEVVKMVKRLGADEMFINAEIRKEYERIDALMAKEEAVAEAKKEALKEAKKEALKEAKKEALKEAKQEIQEAKKQGIEQTKINMIKAFFKNNVAIDVIAKSVDMSLERVKQILEIK